jgi:hypothetical protein
MQRCLLCESSRIEHIYERRDPHLGRRQYFECQTCALVSLHPDDRLLPHEEKQRYDLHQNHPDDQKYCDFLMRLAGPLASKFVIQGQSGLDYGCGPEPVLAKLLREFGFEMQIYDPFYFPDKAVLDGRYDLISCSEVVEHFYHPRAEFQKLRSLMKTGNAYLGIMTQMKAKGTHFSDWWYHREPSHVCFYQPQTFEWIAAWLSLKVEFPHPTVVLFS